MAYFTGQGGSVTYSGTNYSVKEWSFEDAADAINVTSTGAGGFKAKITAPRGGSGSFTIIVDASAIPTITSGTTAAFTLAFGYIPGSGPPPVSAGSITGNALITKVSYKNPAEEDVEIECSYETTGSYTL